MKKLNKEEILEKILIIFLVMQPIFDLKIFYNSISTLIRTIFIAILFGIYFFYSKNKKKYILIIYPILLCVYFIFHHFNAMNFKSFVPGNFNYSIIKEMLYLLKMIVPILLIYILYKSKLKDNKINFIIKSIVVIISLIIIITNLLGISYGSYSDTLIKSNFFSWFDYDHNYTYKDLASKGLFEFANQISAVLLTFLPFIIYEAVSNKKLKNICILIINVWALILLGTRVASLGVAIVFSYTICSFVFIRILKKDKLDFDLKKIINVFPILLIYFLLLPINPMNNRISEINNQIDVETSVIAYKDASNDSLQNIKESSVVEKNVNNESNIEKLKLQYIEENYKSKLINENFILNRYPYQYDVEFWTNILEKDVSFRTNYRYLEKQMVKRVVQINNNPFDKFLGITDTRLQNIFNIEQDFIVQYYALGVIGLILVFIPYVALLVYYIYKIIVSKLSCLNITNILAFITILMVFAIAYNSGNLFNSLSFTIYFAILFYKLCNLQEN